MIIGGMMISSLEFPGKISLAIFTAGCILRCPYCHNPELINGGHSLDVSEIQSEIKSSLDFIDSIVVTGGEPLIQCEEVMEIFKYSQDVGLKVKLDTNGCYPERLAKVVKWIDHVALDIKAPFQKYEDVIGADIGYKVKKSIEISLNSANTFLECRTTYVPRLLEPEDILNIAKSIECDLYTIQQFRNRVVLDKNLQKTPNPSRNELLELALKVKPFMKKVRIKTAEFGDEFV